MKTTYKFLSLGILFLWLTSCSSTKVSYDKSVDFSQYKTFAFYKKGIDALRLPAKKKKFVLKTVAEALEDKGFSKSSHPDFIVNVFTEIRDRVDVYPGYGYYSPFYRRAYVEKSKEGTLYIDIVDLKNKKVIWTGRQYMNLKGNDYKQLRKAIYKLLAQFPPKR